MHNDVANGKHVTYIARPVTAEPGRVQL